MECQPVRDALSARLDGEPAGLDDSTVDAHVRTCPACARWAQGIADLHRAVRVQPADDVPDLTADILARAARPDARAGERRRPEPHGAAAWRQPVSATRWALLVVGLTQLVLAGPALLFGSDPGATVHVAREMGGFDVALAVGLILAAWQPARAWGLLPAGAALGVVTGATALVGLVEGSTTSAAEAHHLLDLAGVVLLWAVAHQARRAGRALPRRLATA